MSDYLQPGDWRGMIITGILLGVSAVTASMFAIVCTCLAGLSTLALNWYKYIQMKKDKNKKQ